MHLVQHVQLAPAVPFLAGLLFALVLKHGLGIGVKQRGVVGDADKGCTLSRSQALQLLAEVFRCSTLDTVAAPAQIDPVQVLLHNEVLIVFPLKELGAENFHDLSLNGDALFLGHVLHQLLGDGGAAEVGVGAEEHIDTGLHGGDPVNTLMLIEALVLDSHGGIDQRLGNIFQLCPLPVGGGVDGLQQLNVAALVHIVGKGSFLHIVVTDGPVCSFRQDILLQVITQGAHKHDTADQHDQNNGQRCADGDLQKRNRGGPKSIKNLQQPMGIPLLPGLLRSPSEILICHSKNLHYRSRRLTVRYIFDDVF